MERLGRELPWGPGGARAGCRGGMTLVELLIALTLMVAVAGLALPNMFSILARSTAEEGRRQALAALASARAEAIGAGEPVRVVAERREDGWRLRAEAVQAEGETAGARGAGGMPGDLEELWRPETVALLPRGWVALAPGGGGAGEGVGDPGAGRGSGGAQPVEAVEPVELVMFLPDGGAIRPAERPRFAAGMGAGARQFALKVDRWSGRATLEEQARGGRGGGDEPEEDEADDEGEDRGGAGGGGGEFDTWDSGEGGAQW